MVSHVSPIRTGVYPLHRKERVGTKDAWGRNLSVTEPALCDELAAASGLLIKKAAKTPIVLFRGLEWTTEEKTSARNILRSNSEDMFR